MQPTHESEYFVTQLQPDPVSAAGFSLFLKLLLPR
jgi:hypothetical protein